MSSPPEVAVSIRGLVVRFGATAAVDDVSLDIRPGEVFALLGPNGAGKTTTMRVLTTLLPPTTGAVAVFGLDVRERPMQVRRLLGFDRPRLLVHDEPTIGLDPIARGRVGSHRGAARRHRHDRAADDPLPRGGQRALRPRRPDAPRAVRAIGSPGELEAALGANPTLEDVFRHYAGDAAEAHGDMRQVRQTRRTPSRLG